MADAAESSDPRSEGFKSNAVFARMDANMKANPALRKKVNGTFLFVVAGGPGGKSVSWSVDAKAGASGGSVAIVADDAPKADCTISISDADLVSLATGKLNAMSAYMSGKLKLKGKAALAQKRAREIYPNRPNAHKCHALIRVPGLTVRATMPSAAVGELLKKPSAPKSKL